MIIFYQKDGTIIGTIEGRIHSEDQLKMWIGKETERLVVSWEKVGEDFVPEQQEKTFIELDKNPSLISKYKVDPKTQTLLVIG